MKGADAPHRCGALLTDTAAEEGKKEPLMTYTEAVHEFLLDGKLRGNSRATQEHYVRCLTYFERFTGVQNVEDITLHTCKSFTGQLMDRGLSSVSIQTYVRSARAFLHWLYENEYHPSNLSAKYRLPKAQRKVIDVLTPEEINQLVNCFDTSRFHDLRNLCMCLLMLDSGLRLGEVISLRADRLHLKERYAIVDGKCNKQRYIPLGEFGAGYYARYLHIRPNAPTFICQIDGKPLNVGTMHDFSADLKHKSGIPRIHPHLLRHTFATRYLENGGNIYDLQLILGHTSLEMVKRYLHLSTMGACRTFNLYSPLDNLINHQTPSQRV